MANCRCGHFNQRGKMGKRTVNFEEGRTTFGDGNGNGNGDGYGYGYGNGDGYGDGNGYGYGY